MVEARQASVALRVLVTAWRQGYLPPRGYGRFLERVPKWWLGGEIVWVETDEGPMALAIRDDGCRQLIVFGRILHEIGETALVRELSRSLSGALDIGANVGWYSRVIARANPACQVTAVEPNPSVKDLLELNTNDLRNAARLDLAVADHEGQVDFYCASGSNLASSARPVGVQTTAQAASLNRLLESQTIDHQVDFVKCDVEGGELPVLRGATSLFEDARSPIWLVEADDDILREVGESLESFDGELKKLDRTLKKYYIDWDFGWRKLNSLAELRGSRKVNVFLVPAHWDNVLQDAAARVLPEITTAKD